MASQKNERRRLFKQSDKRKQRFSLRKLSVGTASVLVGTLIFLGSNAKADVVVTSEYQPDNSLVQPEEAAETEKAPEEVVSEVQPEAPTLVTRSYKAENTVPTTSATERPADEGQALEEGTGFRATPTNGVATPAGNKQLPDAKEGPENANKVGYKNNPTDGIFSMTSDWFNNVDMTNAVEKSHTITNQVIPGEAAGGQDLSIGSITYNWKELETNSFDGWVVDGGKKVKVIETLAPTNVASNRPTTDQYKNAEVVSAKPYLQGDSGTMGSGVYSTYVIKNDGKYVELGSAGTSIHKDFDVNPNSLLIMGYNMTAPYAIKTGDYDWRNGEKIKMTVTDANTGKVIRTFDYENRVSDGGEASFAGFADNGTEFINGGWSRWGRMYEIPANVNKIRVTFTADGFNKDTANSKRNVTDGYLLGGFSMATTAAMEIETNVKNVTKPGSPAEQYGSDEDKLYKRGAEGKFTITIKDVGGTNVTQQATQVIKIPEGVELPDWVKAGGTWLNMGFAIYKTTYDAANRELNLIWLTRSGATNLVKSSGNGSRTIEIPFIVQPDYKGNATFETYVAVYPEPDGHEKNFIDANRDFGRYRGIIFRGTEFSEDPDYWYNKTIYIDSIAPAAPVIDPVHTDGIPGEKKDAGQPSVLPVVVPTGAAAEDLKTLDITFPDNKKVTLTRDADGTWKKDGTAVTVENGKLLVPITADVISSNGFAEGADKITATLTDKAGNVSEPGKANIINESPTVEVAKPFTLREKSATPVSDQELLTIGGVTSTDLEDDRDSNANTNETIAITDKGGFDPNVAGEYTIKVQSTDSEGKKSDEKSFVIKIIDPTELTATVKRTITYVKKDTPDGPETASGLPDNVETLTYTREIKADGTGFTDWVAKDGKDTFSEVKSPDLAGYTPDVAYISETPKIEATATDKKEKVIYTPGQVETKETPKANIVFVDDTTGKQIADTPELSKTGEEGNPVPNDGVQDEIDKLIAKGWKLVENPMTTNPTFDNVPGDQRFEVRLTPTIIPVTPDQPKTPGQPIDPANPDGPKWPAGVDEASLKQEVTRVIEYKYDSKTGAEASPTVTEVVKFERKAEVNKVTGEVTYGAWKPVTGTGGTNNTDDKFDTIESPAIEGYTPDRKQVDGSTSVDPEAADYEKQIVVYTKDAQKATVIFVDTKDNVIPGTEVLKKTGKSDELVPSEDVSAKIAELEGKGWKVVTNPFAATEKPKFDKDKDTDQEFKVVLTPKETPTTPENPVTPGQPIDPTNPTGPKWPTEEDMKQEVTRTIVYKYDDGTAVKNPDDTDKVVTEVLKFERTATVNEVTGAITYTDWQVKEGTGGTNNADDKFDLVVSPTITGYTPDKAEVPATDSIDPESDDITEEVIYTKDAQKVTIKIVEEGTNKELITTVEKGGSNTPIQYDPADDLADLAKDGYEFVSSDYPTGDARKFDSDKNVDQTYTIVVKAKVTTVIPGQPVDPKNPDGPKWPDNPTPGQPIDPNNPDGPKWPADVEKLTEEVTRTIEYKYADDMSEAATTVTETVKFTRQATVNQVTKEITYGDWTVSGAKPYFDTVPTPLIEGYLADTAVVEAATPTATDEDSKVVVLYTPLGSYIPKVPEGVTPLDPIPYPNDPGTPGEPDNPDKPVIPADPTQPGEPTTPIPNVDGYVPVVPGKDGDPAKPLQPVNPDNPSEGFVPPAIPVDPSEDTPIVYVKESDLTKTVTRTVKYWYESVEANKPVMDGDKAKEVAETVTFTRNVMVAEDGTITFGEWLSPDTTFDKVPTDKIEGYLADTKEVPAEQATPSTVDYVVDVVYTPLGKYIPKVPEGVTEVPEMPYPNHPEDPTVPGTPERPIPNVDGHIPVGPNGPLTPNNPEDPSEGFVPPTIPVDPSKDTPIVYVPIKDFVAEVTRTVVYEYSDGTAVMENGKPKVITETLEFYRNASVDDKGQVQFTEWETEKDTFGQLDSPVLKGYLADKASVPAATVTAESENINEKVVYKPIGSFVPKVPEGVTEVPEMPYPNDPEDPTKPGQPTDPIPNVDGHIPVGPNGPLTPKDPKDPNAGYVPPTLPEDPSVDTPIVYVPIKDFVAEVTRTVVYEYSDGTAVMENGKPKIVTETLEFYRNASVDDKGQVQFTEWETEKDTFGQLDSPVLKGYLADKASVPAATVTAESENINEKVVYKPIGSFVPKVPAGVTEVPEIPYPNDPEDPTKPGQPTEPIPNVPDYVPVVPGKDGEPAKPLTPKDPKDPNAGYVPPTLPEDPSVDTPIVYVKADDLKQEVTRTVVYEYSDGTAVMENGKPKVVTETLTFTRTVTVVNKETGEVTFGEWMSEDNQFDQVITPLKDGYLADKAQVPMETANATDEDKTVVVVYTPLGKYVPNVPAGETPLDSIPYPNHPNDPTQPGQPTTVIPNVPGTIPVGPNGPLQPKNPSDFNEGFVPPVLPKDPSVDTPIVYVKITDLVETVTRTIEYKYDNGQPVMENGQPKVVTETVGFVRTAKTDATGKVTFGEWLSEDNTFDKVPSPVLTGYLADKAEVAEETAQPTDADKTEVVIYRPIGKYVPNVPAGETPLDPIPYPNNPEDPTKPGEPVTPIPHVPGTTPYVPGKGDEPAKPLTPKDPNDPTKGYFPPTLPESPDEDTPINYIKDGQKAVVTFVTEDGKQVPNTPVLGKDGESGSVIPDTDVFKTIADLDKKGWTVVEGGNPFETTQYFDKDAKTLQEFKVVVKSKVVPVTPEDPKTPGKPIDPTNPEGPKWPNGLETSDLNTTVTRVIKYVDETGKEVASPVTETLTFKRTAEVEVATGKVTYGNWASEDNTFDTVKSPVVKGYVTKTVEVASETVTGDAKDKEVVVVYTPIGSFVPKVPEGETPLNPIPYPNDPEDPSKPGQPTDPIPHVPGTTPEVPSDPNDPTSPKVPLTPVDPEDPTKGYIPPTLPTDPSIDIDITYVKDPQKATVIVVDKEGNKVPGTPTLNKDGKSGEEIPSTDIPDLIKELENKGYKVLENPFKEPQHFDKDKDKDQEFKIVVEPRVETIDPKDPNGPKEPGKPVDPNNPDGPKWPDGLKETDLTTTVTRTIEYKYEDGTPVLDEKGNPKVVKETVTFTRTAKVNLVTGTVTYGEWTAETGFGKVVSPIIPGYVSDKSEVPAEEAKVGEDKTVVVTYKRQPSTPVEPGKPETPEKPEKPQEPSTPAEPSKPSTPAEPAKVTELPQTGDASTLAATAFGLSSILAAFGLGKKRRKED